MKKYILHLDTSGNDGIVALAADGSLLYTEKNTEQRNHAATINIMIEAVLKQAGIAMKDLAAVAVVGGPGSYTGLRIGLATAKGICYALDIPLLMHNKLYLLARQKAVQDEHRHPYYVAILPARSKEYFITLINDKEDEEIAPVHIEEKALERLLQPYAEQHVVVTGSATELPEKGFNHPLFIHDWNDEIGLGLHAKKAFDDLNCNRFVNLYSVEPFYLKAPFTYTKL